MIFRASSKWAGAGLYDLTFSAVTIISNGLVKCLKVPASRLLSTFDRIPSAYFRESFPSEGLVSGKRVHVGSSFPRKFNWDSGTVPPIFLAPLRLGSAQQAR